MTFNPADYPPNWKELSRSIREDRANNQCECTGECGKRHLLGRCTETNGEPAQSFRGRVMLTVAHLDHNTHSDDPNNLRAMCQACHLRYDVTHHLRNRRRRKRQEIIDAGQGELL